MIIISQKGNIIVNLNNGIIYASGVSVKFYSDGKSHEIGTYESDRMLNVVKSIFDDYKNGHSTFEMPKE